MKIHNTTSKPRLLSCGVPQGSVLGLLLFTLYSAPIARIVQRHGLIAHLSTWRTNDEKTLSLLLRTPTVGPLSNIRDNIIGDNSRPITLSPSPRNLCAIFDEHLTIEACVNSVFRSSFFHLHNSSSIRRVLDMKTTVIIVQALVISRLD